jgi:hypothetical protein
VADPGFRLNTDMIAPIAMVCSAPNADMTDTNSLD